MVIKVVFGLLAVLSQVSAEQDGNKVCQEIQ